MTISALYETTKDTKRRISSIDPNSRRAQTGQTLSCTIHIYKEEKQQTFSGFGCALTESSGFVLSKLPPAVRTSVIHSCFGQNPLESNAYTLARTHMNSCDFSLENWACVPQKDETLASFSMERTNRYITPQLLDANKEAGGIQLMISPWSPPAWMKSNNDMNNGGKLLVQYRTLWAAYYVRFIQELQKQGLTVTRLSIQNEPEAAQTWDSCLWTGTEEALFAVQYLAPALQNAGLGSCKILVWDHNRDRLYDRFAESMSVKGAQDAIAGAAFHWYSGDQYENIAKISAQWKDKECVFTEGCIEGGPRKGAWFSGERYAHNIMGDLNNGCTAWIDWNMILDSQGGPNHANNNCDSPILADYENGTVDYQSSYYYIGHFSRFIRPGAVRLGSATNAYMTPAAVDGCMGNTMETTVFQNTDGSIAFVAVNRTEADMIYHLDIANSPKDKTDPKVYTAYVTEKNQQNVFVCPPRSIQTLLISQ